MSGRDGTAGPADAPSPADDDQGQGDVPVAPHGPEDPPARDGPLNSA